MKTKIRWVNVAVYSIIAASGITLWYAVYLLLKAKGVL
jgi:hypothetical protein